MPLTFAVPGARCTSSCFTPCWGIARPSP